MRTIVFPSKLLATATMAISFACTTHSTPSSLKDEPVQKYSIAPAVYETGNLKFIEASGPNYLAMAIPYAPVAELREKLEADRQMKLKNRGEAHITVITPPEFEVLKSKITMKEIVAQAEAINIQESQYIAACIGSGHKKDGADEMSAYFIVVEASRLLELRVKLAALFKKRGGDLKRFDAVRYYPHITMGFTHRDLHLEDGIRKDRSSCIATITAP